jgi:hypothetical protein
MIRSFVAVSVAVLCLTGCPSTEELCKSGVDQVCERVFECQSDAAKASAPFQAAFGTSVENCKELLYANPLRPRQGTGIACDEVDNDQELCSNLGITDAKGFSLGEASTCRDDRNKLSCEDYLAQLSDDAKAPAACAKRCTK